MLSKASKKSVLQESPSREPRRAAFGDEATRNAYGFSQLFLFLGGASHPPKPPGLAYSSPVMRDHGRF